MPFEIVTFDLCTVLNKWVQLAIQIVCKLKSETIAVNATVVKLTNCQTDNQHKGRIFYIEASQPRVLRKREKYIGSLPLTLDLIGRITWHLEQHQDEVDPERQQAIQT